MSSCCRLYDKRSTKDRICLALSGYLSLMQTGWNFLLFVFLRNGLSCERRSHVSANVYLHSTQGVDDSLDVTYECRSVALSPSPTFACTYMCLNTDATVTARLERLHTATSIVSMATDHAVSALCVSGRPLASTRRQNMSIGTHTTARADRAKRATERRQGD